jgi:Nucleotidyl transferase AbiEii toxin, Type IV TA system
MLHKDLFIIAPDTFRLIQELQAIPELKDFYLVGGTALALQLGHRNSIDIDLFSVNEFDDTVILESVKNKYEVTEIFRRKNTIISLVNNIKTDFVRHNYPLLRPPATKEGITYLSCEDIAAMKFHAIIQSGKRLKDFIDVYFLLTRFSLKKMLGLFTTKYTYSNELIALKAVNYFDDIDPAIDPPKLKMPLPLYKITGRIREATLNPDKIFK